jgi:hypothetical protein
MRFLVKSCSSPEEYGATEEALSISVQQGEEDIAWIITFPNVFIHLLTDTPIASINEEYLNGQSISIIRSGIFPCSAVTFVPMGFLRINKTLDGKSPSNGAAFTEKETMLLQMDLWEEVLTQLGIPYVKKNWWSLFTPDTDKRIVAVVFSTDEGIFSSTCGIRITSLPFDERQAIYTPDKLIAMGCPIPIGYTDIFTSFDEIKPGITFDNFENAIYNHLLSIYGDELHIVDDFTDNEKELARSLIEKHSDIEWKRYGRKITTD